MRTPLWKPVQQSPVLWLGPLEGMKFEQVHTGVKGMNLVLPLPQSLNLYQEGGRTIQVPNGGEQTVEITSVGKPTVAAVPQPGQMKEVMQ